jgi:hypothetical protein
MYRHKSEIALTRAHGASGAIAAPTLVVAN